MLLKNHLKEVFKKASIENNFFLKENIVLKWVHRFGIDSLNDLLIPSSVISENNEQISLIDEVNEEENQELISLELLNNSENSEEIKGELIELETSRRDEVTRNNLDSYKLKQYKNTQELPLPYINNLRKWIFKDKKAS